MSFHDRMQIIPGTDAPAPLSAECAEKVRDTAEELLTICDILHVRPGLENLAHAAIYKAHRMEYSLPVAAVILDAFITDDRLWVTNAECQWVDHWRETVAESGWRPYSEQVSS